MPRPPIKRRVPTRRREDDTRPMRPRVAPRLRTNDERAPPEVSTCNLGRILDLSSTGMKIATRHALHQGEKRTVRCFGAAELGKKGPVEVEVMWCREGRAGLRFVDPFKATSRMRHIFRYWSRRASAKMIRGWIDALCSC